MSLHQWFVDRGLKLWTHYPSSRTDQAFLAPPSDRPAGFPERVMLEDADVIMGHFGPNYTDGQLLEELRVAGFQRKCQEWTVLREPLDLVTSLRYYTYPGMDDDTFIDCISPSRGGGHRSSAGPCKDWTLEDIHGHGHELRPGRHFGLHNGMCIQFTDVYMRAFDGADWHPCDLESAKNTLLGFDGVGFLDDMIPTLNAWEALFGLTRTAKPKHSHRTRGNTGFDLLRDDIKHAIVQHNADDIILYHWAVRQFHS